MHPRQWRRTAAALFAGVALVSTIAGCSTPSPASTTASKKADAPGALEIWSRSDPNGVKTYTKIFDEFTKETGIEVDYHGVLDFDAQLQARAASKKLPDVLINDAGSLGNYNSQGWLQPIDRTAISGQSVISDATWKSTVGSDGKYYGIPWSRQATVTFVRKDWLDKVGLPVPKTWADLQKVAHAFATQDPDGNGKDDTYGMVIPGSTQNGYLGWWASNVIWQGGGDILKKNSDGTYKEAVTSSGTKKAVEWIRQQFCTPGNVVPGALTATTATSQQFHQGSAGIYMTGPYNISAFDNTVGADKFVVIPNVAGPAGTATLAEGENIYFGAGTERPNAQAKLAAFLITKKAQELGMDKTTPVVRLPVNTKVDAAAVRNDPRWTVAQDAYTTGDPHTLYWQIQYQPFRQALADGLNKIMSDCNGDIDAGLKDIAATFDTELKNQGLTK